MNLISTIILLVITPSLAVVIGCVGVFLVEETIWGWPLLAVGVGYPPAAIIYYYQRKNEKQPG